MGNRPFYIYKVTNKISVSYNELFQPKSFVQLERISQFLEIKTFARVISQSVFISFFLKYRYFRFVLYYKFRNDMKCIKAGISSHLINQSHVVAHAYA